MNSVCTVVVILEEYQSVCDSVYMNMWMGDELCVVFARYTQWSAILEEYQSVCDSVYMNMWMGDELCVVFARYTQWSAILSAVYYIMVYTHIS